jgi:hypothetical protein
MKTKLLSFFMLSILMFTLSAQAKKVSLRLNLQQGTIYEMVMTSDNFIDQEMMGQKMKINQNMEMVFSYKVLDILPDANFRIEYSMVRMKMKMNINGQEVNLDSESTDVSDPMNEVLKGLNSLKLKIELNSKGHVERVEGLEQYSEKLASNPQMAQTMQMFTNEANFISFYGQTFNYFPENGIEKNDKWSSAYKIPSLMNMEAIMNFEVSAIEKEEIALNVTSDVNMEGPVEQMGFKIDMKSTGTQTGTMKIDPADGWLRQSDLTQKFDVTMKMKNPQSGEDLIIPMVLNSITKITVSKK